MLSYVKIYLNFVRFSCSRAMFFRADFWLRFLMDIGYYIVNIGFFSIIYLQTPSIGGWSKEQSMVLIGAFLVVDAIQMTIFAGNLWSIPILVRNGDLDYYLCRPVSTLFFLSLRDFAAGSFLNLLLACGILTWALINYPGPLGCFQVLLFLLLLLNGVLLHYLIRLAFILPIFWIQSVQGFDAVFFNLVEFMAKPDSIYRGAVRLALLTVLPLALIVSLPARVIIDGPSLAVVIHITSVTIFLGGTVLWIWSHSLRNYASASS